MNVFGTKSSKFSNTLAKRSSVTVEDLPPADGIHSLQFLQQQQQQQQVLNGAFAPQQHNMWDHARSRQLTLSYFPII